MPATKEQFATRRKLLEPVNTPPIIAEFKSTLADLAPDGKEIVPGLFAFEAFYPHSEGLAQIIRRESSVSALEAYRDDFEEVIIHRPLHGISTPSCRQYFFSKSYFHAHDQVSSQNIQLTFQLYVGEKVDQYLSGRFEENGSDSPHFFFDGYRIERAHNINLSEEESLRTFLTERGLCLQVSEGQGVKIKFPTVTVLYKSPSGRLLEKDDVLFVSPRAVEKLLHKLDSINSDKRL